MANGNSTTISAGWTRTAATVGVAALGAYGVGLWLWPGPFLRGYLTAYHFWLALALGSLAILMTHQLTGGAWGYLLRRVLQSSVRTLPLMALLFIPVALGVETLYPWAQPGAMADDTLLAEKARYLNPQGFYLRAAIYFALWLAMGLTLSRLLARHEQTGNPRLLKRSALLSGPGLVVYWLAVTFASVDWVMSLQPHWVSAIFPTIFAVGQIMAAYAFAVLVTMIFAARPELAAAITPKRFSDLGNLLLMLVMFWAYVAFSQFMLIWIGNLPDEVVWYVPRFSGGWQWVAIALVLLQFAFPFLVLLLRKVKRTPPALATVCALLLFAGVLNLLWQIVPSFLPANLGARWAEIGTTVLGLLGIGGVWLAVVFRQLGRQGLLPANSPLVQEPAHHG